MNLSKYSHIIENRFKIGAEIECFAYGDKEQEFCNAIEKINHNIYFDYDGSLKPNSRFDAAYELITPVLPASEALKMISDIFDVISKFGYTNNSSGIHINISPLSNSDYYKINPFKLTTKSIWTQFKKSFGRGKNRFCRKVEIANSVKKDHNFFLKHLKPNFKIPRKYTGTYIGLWRSFTDAKEDGFLKKKLTNYVWHYGACNLDNLHPTRNRSSRVEIRCAGGKNYEFKIKKLAHYINRSLKTLANNIDFGV